MGLGPFRPRWTFNGNEPWLSAEDIPCLVPGATLVSLPRDSFAPGYGCVDAFGVLLGSEPIEIRKVVQLQGLRDRVRVGRGDTKSSHHEKK